MRPVVLIILDGWGIAGQSPGNAISRSKLSFYNSLLKDYPNGRLQASGESVGLPRGVAGNTETGHLNIGAGFIVHQDLVRINFSIASGSFFQNTAFHRAIDHARKYESNLHLLGLIGSGGVHANIEHLTALLELFKEQSFRKVYLHLITDGRDSPPKSCLEYIKKLQSFITNIALGEIATIMGRYYAMDRDQRWERTKKAYEALTESSAEKTADIKSYLQASYTQGITDEFLKPVALTRNGKLLPRIKDHDSVIFFNYRIDRPRQLTKAFVMENFSRDANTLEFDPFAVKYFKTHHPDLSLTKAPFVRKAKLDHLYFVTMTEYSQNFHVSNIAFPPQVIPHPLGEVISQQGLSQLRLAESEKERFVTYYFNGQRESPFIGEDRIIIPSPKVATYDLKPEMSSFELTDIILEKIRDNKYDFILLNFAAPDMVAHTGVIEATVQACSAIDRCLEKIAREVLKKQGTIFITADHGNAEELINAKTGGIDTEHSIFPVPFIIVNNRLRGKNFRLPDGVLADIAPTILNYMHIRVPGEMKGRNLFINSLHF